MNIKLLFLSVFLILFYILVVSVNLMRLPLYLDEGLYIFWASLIKEGSSYVYVSMQDGKTPLFMWLIHLINPFFGDYLYTGRFISVIASAISLICSVVIGWKIGGRLTALFVYILFLITPFNLLVSRMAFVDSLLIALGSLSILSLFFIREFAEKKKVFIAIIFALVAGVLLGMAFMTKTTAKIFLVAESVVLISWILQSLKSKKLKEALVIFLSLPIIVGIYFEILGYLKFGALRHWEMIANKEGMLVYSLQEIFHNLFTGETIPVYVKNLPFYFEYLVIYFGPILIFFVLGLLHFIKDRKQIWLVLITIIFSAGIFLSAKIPASRYLSIIVPPFIIISALGLKFIWQKNNRAFYTISVVLLLITSSLSFRIIADPLQAFYSSDDRNNFVNSDLNALGLNEIIEYLGPQSKDSIIGVEGTWGVSEGMLTRLQEHGIETQLLNKIIPSSPVDDKVCNGGHKNEEGVCWKSNFGDLTGDPRSQKFVYLTASEERINFLKTIADIEVIREFRRSEDRLSSYFVKIN